MKEDVFDDAVKEGIVCKRCKTYEEAKMSKFGRKRVAKEKQVRKL